MSWKELKYCNTCCLWTAVTFRPPREPYSPGTSVQWGFVLHVTQMFLMSKFRLLKIREGDGNKKCKRSQWRQNLALHTSGHSNVMIISGTRESAYLTSVLKTITKWTVHREVDGNDTASSCTCATVQNCHHVGKNTPICSPAPQEGPWLECPPAILTLHPKCSLHSMKCCHNNDIEHPSVPSPGHPQSSCSPLSGLVLGLLEAFCLFSSS